MSLQFRICFSIQYLQCKISLKSFNFSYLCSSVFARFFLGKDSNFDFFTFQFFESFLWVGMCSTYPTNKEALFCLFTGCYSTLGTLGTVLHCQCHWVDWLLLVHWLLYPLHQVHLLHWLLSSAHFAREKKFTWEFSPVSKI